MSETIRVYVAGPLFGSGRVTENVRRAIEVADRLRAGGVLPFVPHLFTLWDTVLPHVPDYWLDMDLEWLLCCDAILRIEGESQGSDIEERYGGAHGIPVYYEGPDSNGVWRLLSDVAEGRLRRVETD